MSSAWARPAASIHTTAIAHELKNPLSILRMNIQLLREDFGGDDSVMGRRVAKRAEVLEMQARRLQETLDEFLRFVRSEALQLGRCSVNELLQELLVYRCFFRCAHVHLAREISDICYCPAHGVPTRRTAAYCLSAY